MSDNRCSACDSPDQNGDYWPDGNGGSLCQMCWEELCDKAWWEECAKVEGECGRMSGASDKVYVLEVGSTVEYRTEVKGVFRDCLTATKEGERQVDEGGWEYYEIRDFELTPP